ncbi:hypothetical protein K1T71_014309 [Dendrolimus kikuchii]|uniref:Uncharacterized protein n=1 Tax=Dendrolimus kikuchii TaxID=765133 RepID=A0ACC1CFP2_9NEOP|nr:hypothetical protein K1T71_014309 [Dendrolimus kikuchii]
MSYIPLNIIKMQNQIFLLVVLFKCVLSVDQSVIRIPEVQPIRIEEKARQTDIPEVVLQLKYDGGKLDRVYFTQFRKPASKKISVVETLTLCTDLCQAGLGGQSCGPSCQRMIPVGLQPILSGANDTEASYGRPRYAVCPVLCNNNLGNPLCNCVGAASDRPDNELDEDGICNAFCADGYTLGGCPNCHTTSTIATISQYSQDLRVLNTSSGWVAWCNVQCVQGHGGAACNCDRPPL